MALEEIADDQLVINPTRKAIVEKALCSEKAVIRALSKMVGLGIILLAEPATNNSPAVYIAASQLMIKRVPL